MKQKHGNLANLRLKKFKIDDIELINFVNLNKDEKNIVLKMRNHDTVRKWMYNNRIISPHEHYRFIWSLKKDSKNFYFLVRRQNKFMGVVYLTRVDFMNRNGYLGLYANPFFSEKKIGTILGNILLKLAFDIAGLHTLKLEVIEDNERAIHLYKKLGFVEEGRLREFVFRDGKWKDVIIMGMTEEEYRRKRHESGVENRR
ncbi:MAG: UDP-4-amino-4,6-dideoxy-N-acetyl-beta-L-altrosamine N-acetyltransferase [Candidatus Hadarchaeales archaeon]